MAPRAPAAGLAAAALFALLQLALLGNPELVELNPEELYNAAHAEAILALGPAVASPLQYRPFCGGCTLDAALGAGLFGLLGPSLLAWKLVPILLGALGVGTLVASAWRHAGRACGQALALALILAPPAWSRLGLVAWGNHYECSAVALLALALALAPPRPRTELATGLALGLGVAIGWSGAFAALGMGAWLGVQRRWAGLSRLALGAAIALAPVAWRAASTGQLPTATIYHPDEAVPSLARLPSKLMTLLPPTQLAGLLGVSHPTAGPALGVLAAASLGGALALAARRPGPARLAATLLGAWLAVYGLVRFQVQVPGDGGIPSAEGLRYAAPAMVLAVVVVALSAGQAWQRGARLAPTLLLLPWLLAGLGARAWALAPPFPSGAAARMWPGDMAFFREQASWALPVEVHRAALADAGPRLAPVHAYALGRAELADRLSPGPDLPAGTRLAPPTGPAPEAWAQGIAAVVVDRLDAADTGDGATLVRALAWVEQAGADWPDAVRDEALREVAWRRVDGAAPQPLVGSLAGPGDLRALDRRLDAWGLSPAAARATWWAAGRRWGRDRARLWQPGPVELPGAALPSPPMDSAFFEGLGQALGERWGPAAETTAPATSSPAQAQAWAQGVAAGVAARWRGGKRETE
ncbi:hypothetical protein L6R53_10270 [Myxococcota bacterium]|nr:hypothetical protein [Myxococcota bacterium]